MSDKKENEDGPATEEGNAPANPWTKPDETSAGQDGDLDADAPAGSDERDEASQPSDDPIADTKAVTGQPDQDPDTLAAAEPRPDEAPLADTAEVTGEIGDSEPEPEPRPQIGRPAETPSAAAPAERVIERRGGFLPALLGGVIAAILGFLVARSDVVDPYLPADWRANAVAPEEIAALRQDVEAQSARIEEIAGEIPDALPDELTALPGELSALSERVSALSGDIDALRQSLADLEPRIVELEQRPVGGAATAEEIDAVIQRELEALRTQTDARLAEVTDMLTAAQSAQAEASGRAARAAALSALARVQAALAEGAPYADALDPIAELTEIPAGLSAGAADGAPTLAALQAAFPSAAREALAAARTAEGGAAEGIGAFFRRQLGARSVEPRAGDDPDAVLSRAEAAVMAGNLSTALDELSALPEPAQQEISAWIALAEARQAALSGAAELSQRLSTD